MSCQTFDYNGTAVTITRGPQMEVTRDEKDGDERWCFKCRERREFRFIVRAPSVEDMMATGGFYGPTASIECAKCGTDDGDCFPGRYRIWGDD